MKRLVFVLLFSILATPAFAVTDNECAADIWCTRMKVNDTNKGKTKNQLVPFTNQYASSGLVTKARRYIGMNAKQIGLHRTTLWCAAFINHLLGGGTKSDLASSFASYGRPTSKGCVGCIALVNHPGRRKGIDHVGIVTGYDSDGNPVIISGNSNGRKVYEGAYPSGRVVGYRAV